jgi:hypothetical protein
MTPIDGGGGQRGHRLSRRGWVGVVLSFRSVGGGFLMGTVAFSGVMWAFWSCERHALF